MKTISKKVFILGTAAFFMAAFTACSSASSEDSGEEAKTEGTEETAEVSDDPMSNKGIGPVTSLKLDPVDDALAKKGEELFTGKCSACHALDKRVVGPAMASITERRSPEWIMNMMLNPEEMVQKDPIAKELLAEYIAPMANQSLTEDEARSILEFFRKSDQ